jgi:hypothetical protein
MLRNILRWARTTKLPESDTQFAVQQTDYLGKTADSAMLFPYGFYANIPPDVLALICSVQGHANNRVELGCLLKERPDFDGVGVALYHPLIEGLYIRLEPNGEINIKSNVKINIEAPETEFTGIVKANGKVIDDTHGHAQSNDSGGNSEVDISGVL